MVLFIFIFNYLLVAHHPKGSPLVLNFFYSQNSTTGAQKLVFASGILVTSGELNMLLASGILVTSGELGSGSPVVTYLPLANMMLASGKLLPLTIVPLANHQFASSTRIWFVSGKLFPTSDC